MNLHEFSGSQVVCFENSPPLEGNPAFADLSFSPRHGLDDRVVAGAGIYAICFDGQLIYLGKFLGKRGNPAGGNIVDARWTKHLGTLTMRGRRVSVPRRTIDALLHAYPGHPVAAGIRNADADVVSRDRGCVSSVNRARFAVRHWEALSAFNRETLDRFQFLYGQVQSQDRVESHLRREVSALESRLVKQMRPCCNGHVDADAAGRFSLEETRRVLQHVIH